MMHILLFPAVKRPIIPEIKSYFMILANDEVSSKWFALRSCCDHQARDSQLAPRGVPAFLDKLEYSDLFRLSEFYLYRLNNTLTHLWQKSPASWEPPHQVLTGTFSSRVYGIAPDIDAIDIDMISLSILSIFICLSMYYR